MRWSAHSQAAFLVTAAMALGGIVASRHPNARAIGTRRLALITTIATRYSRTIGRMRTSMRRFWERPSGVSFEAIGWFSPCETATS